MAALAVLALLYVIALVPDFFAYAPPLASDASLAAIPPQPMLLFERGRLEPHVAGLVGRRDPWTRQLIYRTDPERSFPVKLFVRGYPYRAFGLLATDRHLFGVADDRSGARLHLLGTDSLGRDQWSRLVQATSTSLTIGLFGVVLSLTLGSLVGAVSGYLGGIADLVTQRLMELLWSIPTIPLWLGLTAVLPRDWSVTRVYFALTIIIALLSWAELARVVRGRFLAMRESDLVAAAKAIGCSHVRIILRHMLPETTSHLIAAATLAVPSMIIAETSLSFLGLGLRPPAVSWGVMLKDAQSIEAIANTPWLLAPGLVAAGAIIAFNLLGDGLRDAADPFRA